MIWNLYVVHDSKTEAYLKPVCCPTDAAAARMITSASMDPATDFAKFAEDYTLVRVGVFDDTTGAVDHSDHKIIATVESIVKGLHARQTAGPVEEPPF